MEKQVEYNQNYPPAYDQATGPGVQQSYPPMGGYNNAPQQQQQFYNPPAANAAPTAQYPVPVSVPIIPTRQPNMMIQPNVQQFAPTQGVYLGPNPTMVTCPSCHQTQMSQIRYESSTKTHLFATILCLTTCCCCIPYMIDSCKNANHICTNCGAYLGTYNN